jgi:hypothetical protein
MTRRTIIVVIPITVTIARIICLLECEFILMPKKEQMSCIMMLEYMCEKKCSCCVANGVRGFCENAGMWCVRMNGLKNLLEN